MLPANFNSSIITWNSTYIYNTRYVVVEFVVCGVMWHHFNPQSVCGDRKQREFWWSQPYQPHACIQTCKFSPDFPLTRLRLLATPPHKQTLWKSDSPCTSWYHSWVFVVFHSTSRLLKWAQWKKVRRDHLAWFRQNWKLHKVFTGSVADNTIYFSSTEEDLMAIDEKCVEAGEASLVVCCSVEHVHVLFKSPLHKLIVCLCCFVINFPRVFSLSDRWGGIWIW